MAEQRAAEAERRLAELEGAAAETQSRHPAALTVATAASTAEIGELREALREARTRIHQLAQKVAEGEQTAAQHARKLQEKQAMVVSVETWGNRCLKDLLEQFDYREIAIRVGIRQEELDRRTLLLEAHLHDLQRLSLAALHRQEIRRVRRADGGCEMAQWSPDHRWYLERIWDIAGVRPDTTSAQRATMPVPQASPPSSISTINTTISDVGEVAPLVTAPAIRHASLAGGIADTPPKNYLRAAGLTAAWSLASPESLTRSDGPALGSLAGQKPESAAFAGTTAVQTDHLNPREVRVGAVCRDSATLTWSAAPCSHPRALYQVWLADGPAEFRAEAPASGSNYSLQPLKPNRAYRVTVRVLVEPAMSADKRLCVVTFKTTDQLEPCSGASCTVSTEELALPDLKMARVAHGRGHPPGLAIDKHSLSPAAALLQWTALPNHFPAQYFVWLSRDGGISYVACGVTGSNHFMLRDLEPGTAYHASVTSGQAGGSFHNKGSSVAFSTKTKGRDAAALPPPKAHSGRHPETIQSIQEELLSPSKPPPPGNKFRLGTLPGPGKPPRLGGIVQPSTNNAPIWAEKPWLHGSPTTSMPAPPEGLGFSVDSIALGDGSLQFNLGAALALIADGSELGDSANPLDPPPDPG
eukprot:EG_transcript_3616